MTVPDQCEPTEVSRGWRLVRRLLMWGMGLVILVFVILGVAANWLFSGMCGNELLAESPSPDGRYRAVVFERDCGATSPFSTQVSILEAGDDFDGEGGNTLVADTNHGDAPSGPGGGPEVSVRWLAPNKLQISHHGKARVFMAEKKVGEVDVGYTVR
jgi:hypothetical protein